jgi:hypothetical protein
VCTNAFRVSDDSCGTVVALDLSERELSLTTAVVKTLVPAGTLLVSDFRSA